jgi:hypothetical protein
MDIISVPVVINSATDTMIVKARLPNGTGVDSFLFGAERKPALNITAWPFPRRLQARE